MSIITGKKNRAQGVRHPRKGVSHCKITLTVSEEMMQQVREEAARKAVPSATWVRMAIVEHLQTGVSDTPASRALA